MPRQADFWSGFSYGNGVHLPLTTTQKIAPKFLDWYNGGTKIPIKKDSTYTPPGNGSGTDFVISNPAKRVCKILNNQYYYPTVSSSPVTGRPLNDADGNLIWENVTSGVAYDRTYFIDCGPRVNGCSYSGHASNQATVDGAFVYPRITEPIIEYSSSFEGRQQSIRDARPKTYYDANGYPAYLVSFGQSEGDIQLFVTLYTNFQLQGYVDGPITFMFDIKSLSTPYYQCSDDTGKTAIQIHKTNCIP